MKAQNPLTLHYIKDCKDRDLRNKQLYLSSNISGIYICQYIQDTNECCSEHCQFVFTNLMEWCFYTLDVEFHFIKCLHVRIKCFLLLCNKLIISAFIVKKLLSFWEKTYNLILETMYNETQSGINLNGIALRSL